MRAGPMRLRGILQSRGDETLQGVQWTDVATIWFAIQPFRGTQVPLGESMRNPMQHVLKIRYRAGVDASMRIKMGARIFDFISVADSEGKHREWTIEAMEGASDG